MFLATTALSEFWDSKEEILFLGPWCLRDDQRDEWGSLKFRILPSPWNDRERFHDAAQYVHEYGDRLLAVLADYFNAIHETSFSQRYWRILLSPWLLQYVQVLYDRYILLTTALAQEPTLGTMTLDPHAFHVPSDTSETTYLAGGDLYSLQLFSQLLAGLGYSFPVRQPQEGWPAYRPGLGFSSPVRDWKATPRIMIRTASGFLQRVVRGRATVALHHLYFSKWLMWRLVWQSGFRALPLDLQASWPSQAFSPAFDERRNELGSLPALNEFERLAVQLLPGNLPPCYLEGYRQMRERALQIKPTPPPVIVSAVGWYYDELFKFFAAESSERGSRLVAMQHGAGYGLFRFSHPEWHESRIADTFFVWGAADRTSGPCRNLASPRLSSLPRRRRARSASGAAPILLVTTTNPRYLHQFYSAPQSSQLEEYFDWEMRFLDAMSVAWRSCVLVRLHRHEFGHPIQQRITARFPEVRWDDGRLLFHRFFSSRLVVIDHLGTPTLEVFAADVPTVLFWDPNRWEVRRQAEPDIERLRACGILWDSPEAAAAHVEAVAREPAVWWSSAAVQAARRTFADRYALARPDWCDAWANALADESAVARQRGRHPLWQEQQPVEMVVR